MGKEVKTMYEGLVNRLRNCATGDPRCNICSLATDDFCCETLMMQASNAIESLEAKVQHYEDEEYSTRRRIEMHHEWGYQ